LDRRVFLTAAAAALAEASLPFRAFANVPQPYNWDEMPPTESREAFIVWAVKTRAEDPKFLGERFDRFRVMVANKDVWDKRDMRAFLMVPR
jgi:protein-L-isoaspartate(D-aspartate) O-methyltransferase